jgi:hypothetical protein
MQAAALRAIRAVGQSLREQDALRKGFDFEA